VGANDRRCPIAIRAGQYGQDGLVITQLPLNSTFEEIKNSLLANNDIYSMMEERKVYARHVRRGKRLGVKANSEIPYGEDRDGDGKNDKDVSGRNANGDGMKGPRNGGGGRSGGRAAGPPARSAN